jgi:hypothetical protein
VERIAASPAPRVSELAKDVDPGLAALVGCCLEREPARRFDSAGELACALDRHARPPLPVARPARPAGPRLMDGDDMPTMKWDRGILRALPAPRFALPDRTAPTLPDPLEAPTLSRGAPLTMRLGREEGAATPPATGAGASSTAPLAHPSSAPASAGERSSRPRLAAAAGLGALALVVSGVSLFRALSAGTPAPVAPAGAVVADEAPPFATPAGGEASAPRDEPRPEPTAEASAPRPGSPVPEPSARQGPKAARPIRRDDGGKPGGAPVWLKKTMTPGR